MKRLHVHVAVENLSDSIRFYSALFAAQPSVIQADYAKWMLDDPRVNFAVSQRGATAGLNHLGVQVESAQELAEMQARLQGLPASVTEQVGAACCYAKSNKYWVTDPQGLAWETFHTLDNIPVFGDDQQQPTAEASCCIPLAQSAKPASSQAASPCCVPKSASKTQPACCAA